MRPPIEPIPHTWLQTPTIEGDTVARLPYLERSDLPEELFLTNEISAPGPLSDPADSAPDSQSMTTRLNR